MVLNIDKHLFFPARNQESRAHINCTQTQTQTQTQKKVLIVVRNKCKLFAIS